jgi:glucose-6-phosphate isomerase
LRVHHELGDHHRWLVAHCFAQAEAFARGRQLTELEQVMRARGVPEDRVTAEATHRELPGGHPSTLVLLEDLSPESVGALVAMHEHKVFVQGMIWRINSFDQWGVELGKIIGDRIEGAITALEGDAAAIIASLDDPTTRELVKIFRSIAHD